MQTIELSIQSCKLGNEVNDDKAAFFQRVVVKELFPLNHSIITWNSALCLVLREQHEDQVKINDIDKTQ